MSLPLIYIFHPYIRYIYNYYIVHINACSMSIASADLTSPTIIRSGRIRRADLIRSRMVTAPPPSTLAFLASRRTRFGTSRICSSALSSIVIMHTKISACYYCFKNNVFTRNFHVLGIKKAPYIIRVLITFCVYFVFKSNNIRLIIPLL